jgi:hypothetical protein
MRFEVLTAVKLSRLVSWTVTPRGLAENVTENVGSMFSKTVKHSCQTPMEAKGGEEV